MTKIIADPAVKWNPCRGSVRRRRRQDRHGDVSRDEQAAKGVYPGAMALPSMTTGASDQAQLRAKGIQSYGIGPASTEADATDNPAHGDVERLAESCSIRWCSMCGMS